MYKASLGQPDFSAMRGAHLLIALSGGADSVALAVMLAEARDRDDFVLSAAHVDHAIRSDSVKDAEWCQALCTQLDIPLYSVRIDIPAESARNCEGLETTARRLRYAWLRQLKATLGAKYIALAHHMDDQAETVLMHLARGTGPEGIGGMSFLSGDLYRPLLGWRKAELKAYLMHRGFSWCEDVTNAMPDTPRNVLRLKAVPALERAYPGLVRAIARYAQSARIESDYVAGQTELWMEANLSRGPYGACLHAPESVHAALLSRAVRRLCGEEIGWERLNAVTALVGKVRGREEISGSLYAEKGRNGLFILEKTACPPGATALLMPGKTVLPGFCEVFSQSTPPRPIRNEPMRQALDAAALQGAVVRTRRPGDCIRPLGCGEKLLSDYLIDHKIDRPMRDWIPLVARGKDILWVCGLGIAHDARISDRTREAMALECHLLFDMPGQ